MGIQNSNLSYNYGGPIHYLGNRYLTLPDLTGHMTVDHSWLNEQLSVIGTTQSNKFERCFEPFAGSASWSLAAMEMELANQYIINDSDRTLINTHKLIRDKPEQVKKIYYSLISDYDQTSSKRDYFLQIIKRYNQSDYLNDKSLLLPFIINHSWSGIIYHDKNEQILYREIGIAGKNIPGYLEESNITFEQFSQEVDRVHQLLNSNDVIFESGDFLSSVNKATKGDLVVLNPPYPENKNAQTNESGMYLELYSHEQLYINLQKLINQMETKQVSYFLTYGFYNPEFKEFVIQDNANQVKHFFRILGYDSCAWGIALDQLYYSNDLAIPHILKQTIVPANKVLEGKSLTIEEALKKFKKLTKL